MNYSKAELHCNGKSLDSQPEVLTFGTLAIPDYLNLILGFKIQLVMWISSISII